MKILLVSHGTFAHALRETAEMIVGPQANLFSYGILPGQPLEEIERELQEQAQTAHDSGEEILILTDLFFGTPFNMVVRLMENQNLLHITGINLPLLLEILGVADHASLDDIRTVVQEKQAEVIRNVNDMLKEFQDI